VTDTEPSDLPGQVVDVTAEVLETEDNEIKQTDTNNDISDTHTVDGLEETEEKQDDMDETISGNPNGIEDNENDMEDPEEVDDDMD
jgi:hypothetical protein